MIFYKTVSENTELKPVLKKDYYLYNFFYTKSPNIPKQNLKFY